MINANKADAAVLLLRTSCSKQDIDSSMNQQEPPCRNYIRKLGFEKYNVYSIKESSTRGNRPKFHKMLNDISASCGCTAIVCASVDRLSRRFNEVQELDLLIKQGKIQLHFVLDKLVLTKDSSSTEIKKFRLLLADAEETAMKISETTKLKNKFCCEHGRYPGHAPLGYENRPDEYGQAWIYTDKQKAPLVAEIFTKFANGSSIRQLVAWSRETELTSVNGKPLDTKAIKRILQNPFYAGKFSHNGEIYEHCYEQLTEKDIWQKCQTSLKHCQNNGQ